MSPLQKKSLILAIRSCRESGSLSELLDCIDDKSASSSDLIERVLRSGHTSILEHINYTFLVENLSLVARSQFFRHRMMSPTEQSKRAINALEIGYFTPDSILNSKDACERYEAAMERSWDCYEKLVKIGIPKEDARHVLPVAQHTQFVVTINGRELYDVIFPLRLCRRAQSEVKTLAERMYEICLGALPEVFMHTGPKCLTGRCNEAERCGA